MRYRQHKSCQGAMRVGHRVPSIVVTMGSIDCSSCVSMHLWSYPPLQSKKPGVNPFQKGTGQLFKGAPRLLGAVCM